MKFRFRYGGYADDIVLFGPSEEALSEALLHIQKVAGDIGLDINMGKSAFPLQSKQRAVGSLCQQEEGSQKML